MTKLVSRIATGIAILGLAAPAFAATASKPADATAPASAIHQVKTNKHKRVASANEQKASPKKTQKKVEKKGAVKGGNTEAPAAPSAAPAPATK